MGSRRPRIHFFNEEKQPTNESEWKDEMDKVFRDQEKGGFLQDIAYNSDGANKYRSNDRYLDEGDFVSHRLTSYPTHVPLKSKASRSRKKRRTVSESKGGSSRVDRRPSDWVTIGICDEEDSAAKNLNLRSEEKPGDPYASLSEAFSDNDREADQGEESRPEKVKFHFESSTEAEEPAVDSELLERNDSGRKWKIKNGKKHKRKKKYSDDLSWRTRVGSDIAAVHRVPTEIDEAITLQEGDLDDLASHRYDHLKSRRRHHALTSLVHIRNRETTKKSKTPPKKMFDHSPHEIFVELDELQVADGNEWEWKEMARWIKYEEDREENTDRWGQPHIASLSFHSLINLRKCIETGVIILDLEETDISSIAKIVVDKFVFEDLLDEMDKAPVLRALLLRHRHVDDQDSSRFNFNLRRGPEYSSLQALHRASQGSTSSFSRFASMKEKLGETKPMKKSTSVPGTNLRQGMEGKGGAVYVDPTTEGDQKQAKPIMRKIPEGAEATAVLVGALGVVTQPLIAFVRLAKGEAMPTVTEVPIPVRFIFLLIVPVQSDLDYHEIGRSISTLMSNENFHDMAYRAESRSELLSAFNDFLEDSIVLPPGDWEKKNLLPLDDIKEKSKEIQKRRTTKRLRGKGAEESPRKVHHPSEAEKSLRKTGKMFGGLRRDISKRYPLYLSDIKDGLCLIVMAASVFIFFAVLSGAITFGGLYSDKTVNLIGVSETLLASAVCGVIFSLMSAQPLVIVGSTGPVLLFDESLFKICESMEIDFLAIRVWIALWLGLIAIIVTMFEGSVFVRFFTRFTQEIFAALISLMFIYESFVKLYLIFVNHPLQSEYCFNSTQESYPGVYEDKVNVSLLGNDSKFFNNTPSSQVSSESVNTPLPVHPNTALLSTILMFGTFQIAYYLRSFKDSHYLGKQVRKALGDFGVPIAIVAMVMLDYCIRDTYTQKLSVPDGLQPSYGSRGWFIDPTGVIYPLPIWYYAAAALPALLIYILIFMETQICQLIVNKRERNLKKGGGFHLDVLLICLMNIVCGFLGFPWVCAATVRSVTHVTALSVYSKTHAPGESPKLVEVKEQRVSSFVVSVLVGLSVLMSPILRKIPMAVLFGVFLYMGISSMNGIQFFERLRLMVIPVKYHPRVRYVKCVKTKKMHLFSMIQLLCLVVLWTVKSTDAALALPFVLLFCVVVQRQLKCIFSKQELKALDSDDGQED